MGNAHRRIGAAVTRLERQIAARSPRDECLASHAALGRMLSEHFRLEEGVVFPLLLLVTGDQARAAVDLLIEEHAGLRESLAEVGRELRGRTRRSRAFEALRDDLSRHRAREARLLYPLSDRLFPETLREQIARKS